jgi:hypothetical protein
MIDGFIDPKEQAQREIHAKNARELKIKNRDKYLAHRFFFAVGFVMSLFSGLCLLLSTKNFNEPLFNEIHVFLAFFTFFVLLSIYSLVKGIKYECNSTIT